MLVETMNYEEVYREALVDSENMLKWVRWHVKDLRQKSLKARKFPFSLTVTHVTPRKNRWKVIFVVLRKIRSNTDLFNVIYTSFHAQEGIVHVQMTPNRQRQMCVSVFPPHFFKRFAERMGIDMKGEELAERYFRYNDSGWIIDKPDSEHEICLCTSEGVCLGELLNDRMFLGRTFIRYDMSLGWQREVFEKMQARWGKGMDVFCVSNDYVETSGIKSVYKERDRSKDVFFHH